MRSKSKFARPYILRLISLIRLTWPSARPLFHRISTAAFTEAHATERLPPIENDDPEFRRISDFAHEAFRRLFELDTVSDEKFAAYLSRNTELIDGASIHRLSEMQKVMPHLLRNVKAFLATHPDEAEPALVFFRKLRPDIAKQEPAEGGSAEWWLERLRS